MIKIQIYFVFLISLILFTLFYQTSSGQENRHYSISGVLMDSTSSQPIEFASVAIYKMPDTLLITGTITNAKGEFVLNKLESGKYVLISSFVGYQAKTKNVIINNASVNLAEPVYLTNSLLLLNEVQITAISDDKQITIEKIKIDVAQSISSVTGNVTEVLKSLSFISIDMDENIYLRGNKNILVLIDGIPTTISTLNSLPASSVDNIEVITNPDAKYDAEGTGGIINIITKRQNLSGLSCATSLNYGFNSKTNGGLSFNYSKGIWNLGFNYNGKYEKNDIQSNLTRQLYTQNIILEQDVQSTQINPTHNAALLISAKPSKKDVISLNTKIITPKLNNIQIITGRQINDTIPDFFFNRENNIVFSRKTIESSLSYKKILERYKSEFSFNASFSRTKGSRPAEYYIEHELLQKSLGGGAPTNMTFQADYFKSIFSGGKIEYGIKGFSRWNSFNYEFYDLDTILNKWNLNTLFSNDLEHHEYIYSSYLMYSDSLFKTIYFKVGSRIEYNTSELIQKSINDRVYKEYLLPFPYLLIKHDLNEHNSIALSINRRITRPSYPQLNPFINVIDQMTYETGNKELQPEIIDKIELNYSLFLKKFVFKSNIYCSKTKDYIAQVSIFSEPDKLIITYINVDKQSKSGGDFDLTYKFNKYFSINSGFSIFYLKTIDQYNELELNTNNLAWTGNLKAIVKPDKNTEFQILLNYNSPIELPQFNLCEIYYADIAVKRTFFNNRFSVSLSLTDIFNTRNWEIQSDNIIYKLNNYSKKESRIFWIGLTYNFNSYQQNKTQKNVENDTDSGIIKLGQ
ncbi:MAG TPA: outer membrane beta-barrel protein [Bacteroidales bacterium]|nr:outer membrane beta-barrel protein [Bacteroidales bacterium]